MIERQAHGCTYLEFERLTAMPQLTHAIFTRRGGYSRPPYAGLNLSAATGDDRATVLRNKALVEETLGLPLVATRAVPGNAVQVIAPGEGETAADMHERYRALPGDAMITDRPGFALCWAYGDCAPILLYDPRHHACALVHAGWRGTAATVAPRAVAALTQTYGTRPHELLAGIGPAIGDCCYEAADDVVATFTADTFAWEHARFERRPRADGRGEAMWLDVAASNQAQLVAAGLRAERIEMSGICAGCRTDLFYSHRVELKPSGRFAVAIGLRAGIE
jgi:polyphenol oxidase